MNNTKDLKVTIAFDGKRFFNNSSGLGNYSRDLLRILSHYFSKSEFLLFNSKKTERGKSIFENSNVHFQSLPRGKFSRQFKMGMEAQNAGADLFHGLSGELPLKWNPKPIKKIVTIHDLIFVRYPQYYSFFDRKIHLWKFRRAAKTADKVIAISEQTKEDIIRYLKTPESKIQVVYQGCHQSFQENFTQEFLEEIREKYKLPQRFILNVGSVEPRKNLLNILRAIEGTDIPLVVIGKKTGYFKKITAFIAKKKMQPQVFFPEGADMRDLAAIYRLADIFIYPSFFEGFGIPVIEALFSETVVITSNVSSLPEAGGPDSVYVNPENFADIRAKINFLWNNPAERERRSRKGLEYAQRFTDEYIATEMMRVYEEVLDL